MSNDKKKTKARWVRSLAVAIGLALGTMGVAAATTAPGQTAPSQSTDQTQATLPAAPDSGQGAVITDTEAEAPSDEAIDGVDHQFEGEEVGNNGDGIPDANEATEADSAEPETDAPGDEAIDGVDHQFEGEEVGNNGDSTPDANEAAETDTNG